jgi:hypothetical protein
VEQSENKFGATCPGGIQRKFKIEMRKKYYKYYKYSLGNAYRYDHFPPGHFFKIQRRIDTRNQHLQVRSCSRQISFGTDILEVSNGHYSVLFVDDTGGRKKCHNNIPAVTDTFNESTLLLIVL